MFKQKNIVVTGASSGLGRALAIELSKKGSFLLLAGRNQDALMKTKALCDDRATVDIFTGDLTHADTCKQLIARATSARKSLDMVFLNAGKSMWARFEDLEDADVFTQMMNINFFSHVFLLQAAMPFLKQSRGHVTAISSFQGKAGVPYHTAYAASKHALVGLIDSLRLEQPKVHFLTVFPSWLKGTKLRENSYVKLDNQTVHHESEKGTCVKTCSISILRAMQKTKKELFIPRWYKWVPMIRFLMPGMLDRIIIQKTQKNIRPSLKS